MKNLRKTMITASGAAMLLGGAALGQGTSIGPDVVYSGVSDVWNWGAVNVAGQGNVRGYSLATDTCNLGNVTLAWNNNGTPVMAMNAYRIHDGRLMQIGMGWCKYACCAASGPGCGVNCGFGGGNGLQPGCMDVYGSGYNGGQTRLGARAGVNPWTGALAPANSTTGNAIYKRLQVREADMNAATYAGALYFVEGVYVGTDDAQANNRWNNASYRRVTVANTGGAPTYNLSPTGSMQVGLPAIYAWRAFGGGVNANGTGIADNSVRIAATDIPGEGRFYVAAKARDLGNGQWRYEYAVYNLNSERSAGAFEVPIDPCFNVTGIGFSAPQYHSGEPYDNTPWSGARTATGVRWESQPFPSNPLNGNAVRWGTMYNFWFTTDAPPAPDGVTMTVGVFRSAGSVPSITAPDLPGPAPRCAADMDCSGSIDDLDITAFMAAFEAGEADFNNDDGVDDLDIRDFFLAFEQGC